MRIYLGLLSSLLLLVLTMHVYAAKPSRIYCHKAHADMEVCAPDENWLFMGDPMAAGEAMVFMNKNRNNNQINSFLVSRDKTTILFHEFDNYLGNAKHEFEKRDFHIDEQTKLANNITVYKISTPDRRAVFYQAYANVKGKIYSFNCMGPHKEIIQKDCVKFLTDIRFKL